MREVSERDIRYSRKVTREEENFLDERIKKKKFLTYYSILFVCLLI